MRLHRWAGAAAVALVLAVAPDAFRLTATTVPTVDRPSLSRQRVDEEPVEPALAVAEPAEALPAAASTRPPVEVPRLATPDGEVYALLIGINDYPGTRRDLGSAVADVDAIDAALAGFGIPPANRVVLRDGQATLPAVTAAVRQLVGRGGPGATYVLGYAGHVRKVDRDTEAMVLADGALLRDAELAALVAPAATQRFWFLLSACYSAGFTELLGPGRVLTAAAGANDLAYENPDLNGSYLIYQMIREGWLRGKAGDSVQEAFAYADAVLARDRPDRRPVQIDQLGAPLVLGAGVASSPPAAPRPPSSPPSSRPVAAPAPSEPEEDPCVLGVVYC